MPFGRQRAAYLVLASLLVFRALSIAVLLPVRWPDQAVFVYTLIAAMAYLILAALVLLVAPRSPAWIVDAVVIVAALIGVASLQLIDAPERHVFVGYTVLILAVYAAYFRPGSRYAIDLTALVTTYSLSVLWAGKIHPAYLIAIDLTVAAISATVFVLVDRLRRQASTDPLTAVLNRHGMSQVAGLLRDEADRRRAPICVALIDLDGFKAYNDVHGHLAGDELLIQVADALAAGLRRVDQIARYGGDEFAVLLPDCTEDQAALALSRIQAESRHWSYGVSEWEPGEPLQAAVGRADAQLYDAKRERPKA